MNSVTGSEEIAKETQIKALPRQGAGRKPREIQRVKPKALMLIYDAFRHAPAGASLTDDNAVIANSGKQEVRIISRKFLRYCYDRGMGGFAGFT